MLVPILVLAVLPLGYFAARTGLLSRTWARRGFLAATILAVLLVLPDRGMDFTHVKRLNLLIAAATALILVLRQAGVGWLRDRDRYLRALGGLAAIAAVAYLNFLSFHGAKTWVHYHDVAHYYLGAKYFRELGYGDLYTAMLRAEAEVYANRFKTIEARDLHTGEMVHIRGLLQSSGPDQGPIHPGTVGGVQDRRGVLPRGARRAIRDALPGPRVQPHAAVAGDRRLPGQPRARGQRDRHLRADADRPRPDPRRPCRRLLGLRARDSTPGRDPLLRDLRRRLRMDGRRVPALPVVLRRGGGIRGAGEGKPCDGGGSARPRHRAPDLPRVLRRRRSSQRRSATG